MKKKKKQPKKLTIRKETLHMLEGQDKKLMAVLGGAASPGSRCDLQC